MAILKLTESQKLWHFNIVLIMILGILFIAKSNPTSEIFSCNEHKVCTLQTSYIIPPLNRTKQFKLNLGCCIEPLEYYNSGKSRSWYEYHLGLDNREGKTIKLFKAASVSTYSNVYPSESIYNEVFKNEIKLFENYKKNPTIGFSIQSPAEPGDFAFWLYAWIIFMTALMIWNILDKKKGAT